MSFVEFNNVTFGYKEDDYLLLEDLSFSAEKNDIITVIGASGCGKSTALSGTGCAARSCGSTVRTGQAASFR